VVKLTLQFVVGYYPFLWNCSGVLMQQLLGLGPEYEVTQSMVLYVLDACIETALGVPLQLYRTFVIEQRHGFNKQTPALFVSDTLKGLVLNCLIAPPLLTLFINVIAWGGPHFYIVLNTTRHSFARGARVPGDAVSAPAGPCGSPSVSHR